jgi:DNA-directed RNA polymerase specialized sigma24 family protein
MNNEPTPLLPAVAQGDMAAFEELYDRYCGALYAVLLRTFTSVQDAQEALQGTFIKAWLNASSFEPAHGSEIAWLVSIAPLDALGAASEDEQRAMQALLDTGIEPVAPPAQVRAAVMDAVDGLARDDEEVERRRLGDSRWWLAIAAIVFLALWGWRELSMRAAREHIASRDAEIQALNEKNTLLAQRNVKLINEIATLAASDAKTISLAGQQAAPTASARAFLEPSKRRALVVFANLPPNPNDKSYQLWITRADQTNPQSAGVFDASPTGTAAIYVDNLPVDTVIKAMAVTLEPKGGVQQPTNTNFIVMGKS